jgi:hypothetical protein
MEAVTGPFRPMILESLAEAEKEGRFRQLIPPCEVDTTQTGYKQYLVYREQILSQGPHRRGKVPDGGCE